jgi:exopolyphosphatase/guanosine-5'-triphosphate,3'-diphosphate pyrophosphatase
LSDLCERSMRARGEAKLRIAVLDLGSTSFHLLVADATPLGEIERVTRRRVMLRLGATISEHGRIPKNVRARAIETAVGLQRLAMELGAEQFLPVGTAALRDAENGVAVASRMSRELGVPVRILSGEEEARLTLAAFRHRVPFGDETALGLDLGGGSLELAIGDAYGVSWETTLRLGVTRLHNELVHSDPMRGRERKAIRRMVREALAPHLEDLASQRSRYGIACGGTLRALARIVAADGIDPESTLGTAFRMPRRTLGKLSERLVSSSHDERLRMRGMKRERADLLPSGAVILETLVDELHLEGLTVCDWGLREGTILEALGLAESGTSIR